MAFDFENTELTELTPKIAVIGVGGAGCNAVNNMIAANLMGVDFIVANTDAQSLAASKADNRIQLGVEITQGLGAGAMPKVGAAAAEEAIDNIDTMLDGCHMAFVTAGMGGGTGTGAAPVIAKRARDKGILTVGVVTKPFHFEGGRRMKVADAGMKELAENVDTLIVIPNQNLFHVANEKTTFADAFKMADNVLHSGVRGITDLMVMDGLINLDFADVRTVMNEMGKAMMGTGEASGDTRAVDAAAKAISNPLLEEASLRGARGVIINVTGGMDMTLFEVDEAVNMVREQVDSEALIVFGSAFNQDMEGQLRVSVVATGIDGIGARPAPKPKRETPAVEENTPAESGDADEAVATPESPVEAAEAPAVEEIATANQNDADASAEETVTAEAQPVETQSEGSPDQDALEAKAVEAAAGTGFVAEEPKQPKASMAPEGGQQANVFSEAAYENTQSEQLSVPMNEPEAAPAPVEVKEEAPAPQPEPEKRSLFARMTSGLRGNAAPANETAVSSADRVNNLSAHAPAEPPKNSELGGIAGADRPAPAAQPAQGVQSGQQGRDQLEIPSFLRKQENS